MGKLLYKYGMRLRGFAPLCQPKDGLSGVRSGEGTRYHNILLYDHALKKAELDQYELDYLGTEGGADPTFQWAMNFMLNR